MINVRSGKALSSVTMLSCTSIVITIAFYFVNLWLFSSNEPPSPTDAFFVEGILFILIGLLFLFGRRGINLWTLKAAILSASAVYDEDTVSPDEIMMEEKWKQVGFARLAVLLILTGFLMILAYFLTL
jgi:hypothetical protein